MNFGSLLIFLRLNKSKNKILISCTVSGPIWPEPTVHVVRRPATRGRPKGWLGLGLATRSDGEAARGTGTARTRDDAVARSPVAWWWLASGKVLPVSLRGPQGGRRARRSGVELTRAAARQRGGGGCFERRLSSVGRELRWPTAMEA
jgi:hypothetical protein